MGVLAASHTASVRTFPSLEWKPQVDALRNKVAEGIFKAASTLTTPLCKSHELYRRGHLISALPSTNPLIQLIKKVSLVAAMVACGALAIFTTVPGIGLRAAGSHLQTTPFIEAHLEEGKTLPDDHTFSLLSWNICCTAGGYAISDGGVAPWSFRIDKIIDKVLETNADVNCLYETFDLDSSVRLYEKLKKEGYSHFYYNIGPKPIGVSSGIFVASKYNIKNPEFTPYPLDSLVGRTKNAAKGVFAFDLESSGKSFARIHATHLQHSEESEFPTQEEISGRKKQMEIICDKISSVKERCIVVTGDLNLDDNEYQSSSWHPLFKKGDLFSSQEKTWGGDQFCVDLVNQHSKELKRGSGPLNLDHSMVAANSAASIQTTLVSTGFEGKSFNAKALSDHAGLLSRIESF